MRKLRSAHRFPPSVYHLHISCKIVEKTYNRISKELRGVVNFHFSPKLLLPRYQHHEYSQITLKNNTFVRGPTNQDILNYPRVSFYNGHGMEAAFRYCSDYKGVPQFILRRQEDFDLFTVVIVWPRFAFAGSDYTS